jgi:Domain of unknown function (DUF3859)
MAPPVDLTLALGIKFASPLQERPMLLLRPITAVFAVFAVTAAFAEPAPPQGSAMTDIVDFGIYCRPSVAGTEAAPDTSLGYVNVLAEDPVFRHQQQEVPAIIGVSFGVLALSHQTILNARMETYRPGKTSPDVWYADMYEGQTKSRGFTFEFEDELLVGLWRMEAWDGDTRLYIIEFDVVPPSALPGIGADCNMLS